MAVPYTVRFAIAAAPADTAQLLFKAPGGYAWIVRDVIVYFPNPITSFVMQLVIPGITNSPLWVITPGTAGTHHLELRQRMEQGDELYGQGIGGTFSITVTGYQLNL